MRISLAPARLVRGPARQQGDASVGQHACGWHAAPTHPASHTPLAHPIRVASDGLPPRPASHAHALRASTADMPRRFIVGNPQALCAVVGGLGCSPADGGGAAAVHRVPCSPTSVVAAADAKALACAASAGAALTASLAVRATAAWHSRQGSACAGRTRALPASRARAARRRRWLAGSLASGLPLSSCCSATGPRLGMRRAAASGACARPERPEVKHAAVGPGSP